MTIIVVRAHNPVGLVLIACSVLDHRNPWVSGLYCLLNRTDVFADFISESPIGFLFMSPPEMRRFAIWDFLRQVIVGKALAVRLANLTAEDSYVGFTLRILATLIVSDLWLKHVYIVVTDNTVDLEGVGFTRVITRFLFDCILLSLYSKCTGCIN